MSPFRILIEKYGIFRGTIRLIQKNLNNSKISDYTPKNSGFFGVIEMAMFTRMLDLPTQRSYFLFGARNTGKSTLIEHLYDHEHALVIDLLDNDEEARYARDPNELARQVASLPDEIKHVIVDEIQKVPKLLDIIQKLMKKSDKYFIMTGSSARKLKRGSANLLAGRAFIYHLFPLTSFEVGSGFNLDQALQWGTLPAIFACGTDKERKEFLNAYSHTYLKEEILIEQVVRNLEPFRNFLEVAAQRNGQIINYSNIARDVGYVFDYYNFMNKRCGDPSGPAPFLSDPFLA